MNARLSHAFEGISAGVQDIVPARWRPFIARHRWSLGAAALALFAALVWYLFFFIPSTPAPKVRAVPVTAAEAMVQDVPVSITALGAAQAWTSVTILAQVSGKLLSVDFAEGTDVEAGQLLAQIDPAPYRAALTQAEGALQRDEALLADARLDLTRYRALEAENAISRQQADTQAALVKQDQGTVLIDKGLVAAANVNLNWCRITSPISGRVGVRLVDAGNLVSASGSVSNTPSTAAATNASAPTGSSNGGSGIVIVNQIQPIAVTFTVPEGEFQRLTTLSDGFRKPLVAKALSQETGALLDSGELRISDNRVDPTTGTVELKARFPNTGNRLWPGQFVNVQLMIQVLSRATTIPVAAVNQGPDGSFLYVVGADRTVSMRPVAVAWTDGTVAAIKSGIRPGETVVTDGQMILKPGSLVLIVRSPPATRQSS
jgi:membrane fusion protein, multidrug efflux system